jgi:uncharacterized NAD(P)/FAD-binding protein YdhS
MGDVVAIAGGGASGVILAIHLLRESSDTRDVVFEPNELGEGVAFATRCPAHLLNVPARGMSAFSDDPAHFTTWLAANVSDPFDEDSFAPRHLFGAYLREIAKRCKQAYAGRFEHVKALLTVAKSNDYRLRLRAADGRAYDADALVLAIGNAAPASWANAPASARFYANAWQPGALEPADLDETVVLLGTGLTAVDAVLELRHRGHRGLIHLVSRRGLLPHEHRLFDAPPQANPEARSLHELMNAMRAGDENWRTKVDGIRAFSNDIWRSLTLADRRRFLKRVLPYWNVHRHRMAPEVATTIAELLANGSINKIAGRTTAFEETPKALVVHIRERGGEFERSIAAQRVINCSGPEHDIKKYRNPLVQLLLAQGSLTPNAVGVGADVDDDGRLIDRDGVASERIFALGPVRFGTLIETTAIPEIRVQAARLAQLLLRSRDVVERKPA